jgi:hypothetical protein
MMRVIALASLVLALACKKEPLETTAGSGSAAPVGPPPPAPADATAPSDALVELLHAMPTTVRVSSTVANKAILPKHLVDRDLQTAWNSHTGDLAGAWIDVHAPGASIAELRMTVGHTGKGPHGEDYFAMNPRITKLAVLDGQKVVATVALDADKRDLQTIKLPARTAHVRVRVEGFRPGSKPSWREICVSELEAWGTPPPGAPLVKQAPRVEVGEPPDDSWMHPPIADASEYCEKLLQEPREMYQQRMAAEQREAEECARQKDRPDPDQPCGDPDPPGEPQCKIETTMKLKDTYWVGVGAMESATDSVYGDRPTQLVVQTRRGFWPVGEEVDCGSFTSDGRCDLDITRAEVNAKGQLEVEYHFRWSTKTQDYSLTCVSGPEVTCTPP